MSLNPTLSEVLREVIGSFLDDAHIALPARVERYDASKQTVDVQPVIKQAFSDEEGARQLERIPVIVSVPVLFPRAGGYRITFHVQPGDSVLLVFSEQALDVWLSEGGEVDPLDDRRSHLTDAVALLGLYDFKHSLSDAPSDRMTLGKDGGLQLHIDGTSIRIGSNSGAELEHAALGDSLTSHLSALNIWLGLVATFLTGLTFAGGPPPLPPVVTSSSVEVKK